MTTDINLMDDRSVVEAILMRDQRVTHQYLYVKCYPLMKSVFDNYYTDCQTCIEFINEIYVHLLTPSQTTGLCKLQSFQFGSTLTTWLKTVAVYYCYEHFRRKKTVQIVEQITTTKNGVSDRLDQAAASMYEEEATLSRHDLEAILDLMPNKRYSTIIRLRYVECLSNEETAEAMQMSMDNFYNKHRRAKIQFNDILKQERQRYERLL